MLFSYPQLMFGLWYFIKKQVFILHTLHSSKVSDIGQYLCSFEFLYDLYFGSACGMDDEL